jgi:hypothetical protein
MAEIASSAAIRCAIRRLGSVSQWEWEAEMFEAEAIWLEKRMRQWPAERLSPLLDVGSSTRAFRQSEPWVDARLFLPLQQRGVRVIHLDARAGDGIDIEADILSDTQLPAVLAVGANAILCSNTLEHVSDPAAVARRCVEIVGPGGLLFITAPLSYPHHRDPIDTMYRPDPDQLAQLFRPAVMLAGEALDVGVSFADQALRRPWVLLRHLLRLPFPFIRFTAWQRSLAKLYWLTHNYRITCAVFEVPGTAIVDTEGRGDLAHPPVWRCH